MTVRLNRAAYDHARRLINEGRCLVDERDDWSEHQPLAAEENRYIAEHGYRKYAQWYLGIDDSMGEETKGRYKFPYGDFEKVHRCGVLAAESRAAQNDYHDIEQAAAHLHGMLEALKSAHGS
jgi:hypothetical protein